MTSYPLLKLEDVNSQSNLMKRIYAVTDEEHRKIFASWEDYQYEDVKKYLSNPDRLEFVMCPDSSTKATVLSYLGSNIRDSAYALSFFWTLRCSIGKYEIYSEIYTFETSDIDAKDEDSKECLDMNEKYFSRENVFTFWCSLNERQQNRLINWYNERGPEKTNNHPYYKSNLGGMLAMVLGFFNSEDEEINEDRDDDVDEEVNEDGDEEIIGENGDEDRDDEEEY